MSQLRRLSSDELLLALHRLVAKGLALEAELLQYIGEMDARRLYLREGSPSMFSYCVEVLHFSEAAAFKRIGAARAARKFPEILNALRAGELHVTGMRLLAPFLTAENISELLELAQHRTGKEIQALLANRQPRPDMATWIRRKPSPGPQPAAAMPSASMPSAAMPPTSPSHWQAAHPPAGCASPVDVAGQSPLVRFEEPVSPTPVVAREAQPSTLSTEPLGGNRYCVRFTATAEMYAQLKELQALMRHQIPDGDIVQILARAVAILLAQVRKQKFGECANPRKLASEVVRDDPLSIPSRRIPTAIRRAVAERDEGRCTFVSPSGRRCGSQTFLEFHHLVPWALQPKHEVDGITLRCRAHNQYEAERDFGEEHMAQFKK